MSPRVGAYICPRGVSGIEYRATRSGIEVTRSFEVPGRIESERQAMEWLLAALGDANITRADLVVTLRGFGTVHHVLPVPPAGDELLAPIVERELRRLEPGLDAPTTSWLPLPSDPAEIRDGPALKQVLAAGAPRHVVETMEHAIHAAGHKLTHLTALPAAIQRLHEEFVGDTEPMALVAPLRDGAFLGFFIAGAMRLTVDPPLAPDEQHDAEALAEETELGATFLRQQFRGAQLSNVVLVAPPTAFTDAESVFARKLSIPVTRIMTGDLSSGGLAALGGVLDARSASPLGLGTSQGKGASGRGGGLRVAANASILVAAVVAGFALFSAYQAREAGNRLRAMRPRLEQESFGLGPVRQTANQRRLIRDALALLGLVEGDRRQLRTSLASLSAAALPPVRLDDIHLARGNDGWSATVAGSVNTESTARSVELLHEFYRDLPKQLRVEQLVLQDLVYENVPAEVTMRGVRFRLAFVLPYSEERRR